MSNMYGKGLKGKATKLHSKVVRQRGSCERCGESDYSKLQAAHIIRRNYAATRCDPEAAWCLCARCHMHTEKWADDFMALIVSTIGYPRYEELRRRAEAGVKTNDVFWQGWIDRLAPMLEDVA